ncbi:MAG: YhcH/YjgK/YiaL family protein [Clostridia bacterium]|nr:YhcH/YjgK/YiaL family protein [Clostridia bacterium]
MLIDEIVRGKSFSFDLGKLGKNFTTAQEFLLTADFASLSPGRHDIDGDNVFVNIQEYNQQEKEPAYEAHAVYADIQLVLQGSERFRWGLGDLGELKGDFRTVTGVEKYVEFTLKENQFVIFLPGEAHAPGLPEDCPAFCRKAVVKVRV